MSCALDVMSKAFMFLGLNQLVGASRPISLVKQGFTVTTLVERKLPIDA